MSLQTTFPILLDKIRLAFKLGTFKLESRDTQGQVKGHPYIITVAAVVVVDE